MKVCARRLIVLACVAAAAAAAASSAWLGMGRIQSVDRNHDGRSDLWRFYDARGQLTRVATDTNFDGRSDQQDFYSQGVLIRRERDRNIDDRVDFIENFDAVSHKPVREVVDVDFNGVADLLVLFTNGVPVFTEQLASGQAVSSALDAAPARRDPSGLLAPLIDPSREEASLSAVTIVPATDGAVALVSTIGLPQLRFDFLTTVSGSRAGPLPAHARQSTESSASPTRGPPAVPFV
jgi:hypothetical protein